jgi:hypothetical protein
LNSFTKSPSKQKSNPAIVAGLFFAYKNESHQFLGRMEDGDIVVPTLSMFLSEVDGEGRGPMANILGGVVECKS